MKKADYIENGKIYSDNGYGTTHIFEIVEKMPKGFEIWNIPEIAGGEYIPICESLHPGNKNCYDVNVFTLKAIKLSKEEVFILHDAASEGVKDVKRAKMALKRISKSGMMKRKQMRAEKALPILERITV